MPFIRSLICLQGFDQVSRFLTLNASFYLAFMLFSLALKEHFVASMILAFVTLGLSSASVLRRINDAGLKKNWLMLSAGLFFVVAMTIIFTDSYLFYWLLMLPAACLGLLSRYPSTKQRPYIMGYFGPVDLTSYDNSRPTNHRIEPSLNGGQSNVQDLQLSTSSPSYNSQTSYSEQAYSTFDFNEQFSQLWTNHKKWMIIALSAVLLVGLSLFWTSMTTTEIQNTEIQQKQTDTSTESIEIKRLYPIEFSDGFTLSVSQYSGLTIQWQADITNETSLWEQLKAKGDDSCAEITFNNKTTVRTLNVIVEREDLYYAQFSPLDTTRLLENIARRNSFNLCGYKFSLKGSKALLSQNVPYNQLASY